MARPINLGVDTSLEAFSKTTLPFDPSSLNKVDDAVPFQLPGDSDKTLTFIRAENWNKLFHYSFIVYEVDESGAMGAAPLATMRWTSNRVQLNIPPRAIRITTPFAMSVVPTTRGVVEYASGTAIKQITISGTTGVFPARRTSANAASTIGDKILNTANIIAPAAASAVRSFFEQAKAVKQTILGSAERPEYPEFEDDLVNTGHYQFAQLYQFLVSYSEHKAKNPNLRLVFECPKDNVGYVVTPISFSDEKSADSPLARNYSISMVAWDQVDLTEAQVEEVKREQYSPRNQSLVRSMVDSLQQFRSLIMQKDNVVRSFGTDVNALLQVYNQSVLALKELGGVSKDLNDFTTTLRPSVKTLATSPVAAAAIDALQAAASGGSVNAKRALATGLADQRDNLLSLVRSQQSAQRGVTPRGESVTSDSAGKQAPSLLQASQSAVELALTDPEVGERIDLDALDVDPGVRQLMDKDLENSRQLSQADVRALVVRLTLLSDQLAYATGSMPDEYIKAYSLREASPHEETRQLTPDDILLQASTFEAIAALNGTLASGQFFGNKQLSPFPEASVTSQEFIPAPPSAYVVGMDRGASIEDMARRYLGSALRAKEIILLNNLRAPFVDEAGQTRSIYAATGRRFVVESDEDLEVGQYVTILASGLPSSRRRILSIEEVSDSSYLVVVDGSENLSTFTPATNPSISFRKPGTVGSGDTILIPSSEPTDQPDFRETSYYRRVAMAERIFGVDVKLTPENDLMYDQFGNFTLCSGYDNALQALRGIIETERGELELHPGYGVPFKVGIRRSDLVSAQLRERIKAQILADRRFSGVDVDVEVGPNYVNVKVQAQGAGNTGLIPVVFRF